MSENKNITKRIEKPKTLYAHPFSKAYWVDAALELKDTKTLVINYSGLSDGDLCRLEAALGQLALIQ